MNLMKRLCAVMVVLSLAAAAGAQTFTVLKTFNPNINATGFHGVGTLAQGPDGTLYGVTTDGGTGAAGVVFRVQTNGTAFTVIKSFSLVNTNVPPGTNADGVTPEAGLVLSGSTLFGTTSAGGSGGSGTVFSLGTNGNNFTVLKSFSALDPVAYTNTDGANPKAALIVSDGVLYGTTAYGGDTGDGTVFRMNINGTGFTNLHSLLSASDGSTPAGRLLLSGNVLYGTTQEGGDTGVGTVFSLNTDGTGFARLHSFSGSGTDGAAPVAGLVLSDGQLFGTTENGDSGDGSDDGTVFRVEITGNNFTTLHSFVDSEGFYPDAELLLSGGTLYGVNGNPYGTVFKIDTDGNNFGIVVNLNVIAGWGPDGGLVLSGGVLYGVTGLGGMPGLGNGVVYSVPTDVGSSLTALVLFAGANGAADPDTGLTWSGNMLFGTTLGGGSNADGSVFEISTNGSGYSQVHDFTMTGNNGDNPDGSNPRAVLVLSGGTFYGTTRYGGTNGSGTVFKMDASGTGFTNVFSFNDTHVNSPIAALVASGSVLYGTTAQGGSAGFGSVFKINTDGTGCTNIYSFNGTDGNIPTAGLVLSGNTLYGTTQGGGLGYGNIFQVNTDGTHYTNIYSFSATTYNGVTHAYTNSDGANPGTVLVLSNNVLYGTTYHGGSASQGTVFKINTDRSGFTVLHTFAGNNGNGAGPGDLLLSGGTLYGTMVYGGSLNQGGVFKLDTSGNNFTELYDFTGGSDGAGPNTTLVLLGNTLYGTTESGGLSGHGTVFSLALSSVVNPIPLNIRSIGNAVVLTWGDPAFSLQAGPLVTGTYTNMPGASSPYTNAISGAAKFFRLRAN